MGLFDSIGDAIGSAANAVGDAAGSAASSAAGAVGEAAGWVKSQANDIVNKLGDAAKWIGSGVKEIVEQLLALGLDPLVISIILAYYGDLKFQARGKWKKLPDYMKWSLKPYFKINLDNIEYAEGISTGHGMAITFENQIYFPKIIKLDTINDIWWIIHEMTHSQQYSNVGGLIPFLHKYIKDIISTVLQKRNVNISKILPLEKAATINADRLAPLTYHNMGPYIAKANSKSFSVGMNLI